jgi:hypothetical protein
VPEFIDPVFTKTSPKSSFSLIENEHFGLVFAKTGSKNLGTGVNNKEPEGSYLLQKLCMNLVSLSPNGKETISCTLKTKFGDSCKCVRILFNPASISNKRSINFQSST